MYKKKKKFASEPIKKFDGSLHASIVCRRKMGEPSADLGMSSDPPDAPSQGSAVKKKSKLLYSN